MRGRGAPAAVAPRTHALALALLAIGLAGTAPAGLTPAGVHGRSPPPTRRSSVALALAVTVRRRWPLPTLAVVAAATTAYLVLGYPYGPILLSFFVAVVHGGGAPAGAGPAAVAGGGALLALLAHVFWSACARPGLVRSACR